MKINEAQAFIANRVLEPALQSAAVSDAAKATIRNSLKWLRDFRRVGDLIVYMDRFRGGAETEVYRSLTAAGLLTFEGIRDEFLKTFGPWASDRTRLEDFIIGGAYRSTELVIFAGVYDNRSGGILPIGKVGQHKAVFVKATLTGGKYANQWLTPGETLKYYLKSRNEVFSERYIENAAIIDFPDVPVYVFLRDEASGPFTLAGIFKNVQVHSEPTGGKWFELRKQELAQSSISVDDDALQRELQQQVMRSLGDTRDERLKRLSTAAQKPAAITVVSRAFIRNADVIAEVLARAAGVCEACSNPAPFERNTDRSPYLEVHHKIPLAAGGEDTVANAVALCPNCHRQEHHGPARWPLPA